MLLSKDCIQFHKRKLRKRIRFVDEEHLGEIHVAYIDTARRDIDSYRGMVHDALECADRNRVNLFSEDRDICSAVEKSRYSRRGSEHAVLERQAGLEPLQICLPSSHELPHPWVLCTGVAGDPDNPGHLVFRNIR